MGAEIFDFNSALTQAELVARERRNDIDADSIKARLKDDAEGFVAWLFSGRALVRRGEARIGDVYGDKGESLSIQLTGPSAGLWKDHATDQGGDLIDLFRAYRGYGDSNFLLAVKEIAAEYFGEAVPIQRVPGQKSASEFIAEKKQKLGDKPRADTLELGPRVAQWKYKDTRGNLLASVCRYEPDGTPESKTYRPYCFKLIDGRREWRCGVPELRPLFQLPEIALEPIVVLVEGEKCAERLMELGIPATTAMQGAKAPIGKTDWSPLDGKTVILWPDNDEAGITYMRLVGEHLAARGRTVVRTVTIPAGMPPKWDAFDAAADGADYQALLDTSVPFGKTERPKIRILDIDDLEDLPPPVWQVDNLMTMGGLCVVWGRSGDLKSWVAAEIGMRIATGSPFFGRETKPGLVLYVAAEGAYGFGSRVRAWRKYRGDGLPKPQFKLIPHAVAITTEDLQHMCEAILALEARPALIVLDTLARTFGAGDENKQADMNAYVMAADRLREETGATVMIIHHAGVGDGTRERGSSVLRGAADTMIKVARKGDKLTLINRSPEGKQKDAEEFEDIRLRVQKVTWQVGETEQSTLLLMEDDDPLPGKDEGAEASEPKPKKYGKVQEAILHAIRKVGEPLGSTRLQVMTRADKSSVFKALESLVEDGALVRLDTPGEGARWGIA